MDFDMQFSEGKKYTTHQKVKKSLYLAVLALNIASVLNSDFKSETLQFANEQCFGFILKIIKLSTFFYHVF
jgi:hypothetical protein